MKYLIAFFFLLSSSLTASDMIYGPANLGAYGPANSLSAMSTFVNFEYNEVSQISILNFSRGSYTTGLLYEFDSAGNIVKTYEFPYIAFTAPPSGTSVGITNIYRPTEKVILKPYTKYGFYWKSTRGNYWYYSDRPMIPQTKNTDPYPAGNYVRLNGGFYPTSVNFIIRLYVKEQE